jgi:SAM-dependent methyltransferase
MLIRLGAVIQSLPVVVMKADDLIEFSRQTYARPDDVEGWAEDSLVDSGLTADELALVEDLPIKKGSLLLLGVGGGREAIPLARMGFRVTGVDFVEAMVERAKQNAVKRGLEIDGMVQEISSLDIQPDTYDVVWLSKAMYSCVPTRRRRIEMVNRIVNCLKPGGIFLCQFHRDTRYNPSNKGILFRRLIARLTLGNLEYEPGDTLLYHIEFIHAFSSEEEVRSELEEGGFQVLGFHTGKNPTCTGVTSRKTNHP